MKLNRDCFGVELATVYLNGEKSVDCFEADDEAGYAWVAVKDEGGTLRAQAFEGADNPDALYYEGIRVEKISCNVEFRFDERVDVEAVKRINRQALEEGNFKTIENEMEHGDGRKVLTTIYRVDKKRSKIIFSDETDDAVTLTIREEV
jgi:hypothetical protein